MAGRHVQARETQAGRKAVRRAAAVCVEALEQRRLLSVAPLPNIHLTTDADVQQQPSIVADQHNPQRLAIAYMDRSLVASGYAGIGVSYSTNGGQAWQKSTVPLPAGFEQGAANPIARFDDQGRLFVSFMATTFRGGKPPLTNPNGVDADRNQYRSYGFASDNGIFVARSDDGGMTWDTPVAVTTHQYDGQTPVPFDLNPDLAIDTFATLPNGKANPNYGAMYAVFSRYYPPGQFPGEADSSAGSNIMLAVSRDGGQSWQLQLESQPTEASEPISVIYTKGNFSGRAIPPGLGFQNWAHLAIGPEGDIYVSSFEGGQFGIHHSSDGGKSFAHPNPDTGARFPFGVNVPVGPGPIASQRFRLQPVRNVVADPTRPGYLYVSDAKPISDSEGGIADQGEILFGRSTDYGATWHYGFGLGDTDVARVVNDDNAGVTSSLERPGDANAQALPRLAIDAQGNLALVWYDNRRDPNGHLLDVFGAVSRDGGESFSPNFRLTTQPFDADAGQFTDAIGNTSFYLGDFLGLSLADGSAWAAWSDTRSGNQDIVASPFPLTDPPAPDNDRFEPNETPGAATNLGLIVQRTFYQLHVAPGDVDHLTFQTRGAGTLVIDATARNDIGNMTMELVDSSGSVVATGEPVFGKHGPSARKLIAVSCASGQQFTLRVRSSGDAGTGYRLDIRALTADLRTVVHRNIQASLPADNQNYFAFTAAASGSIRIKLAPGADVQGKLVLEILDPDTLDVLTTATSKNIATLSVTRDQRLIAHVIGDTPAASGSYRLSVTSFDPFATADDTLIGFAAGEGASEVQQADLDGDDDLDLVLSRVGHDTINVLLNNGDGTFQAPREFAVGAFQEGGPFTLQGLPQFHRDLAIADFNQDGIPDVAVVNTSSSDVSVLLGFGDGTFAPQRRYDATAAPYAMDAGDVNNDGIPDLAVIDSTAGPAQAGVLLGRGDGSFHRLKPFQITPGEPFRTNAIRIADLNRDGNEDLVVRDFVDGTLVLRGNGDGTFLPPVQVQPVSGPGLTVADLNNDGVLDLVTTQNNGGNAFYSLGNGDGTFTSVSEAFSGQFPVAVAVADFATANPDGSITQGVPDGHPDLIVVNNGATLPTVSGPAELVILPGLGNDEQGEFAGFGDPVRLAPQDSPLDVKAGDVDGDGVLDLVVVDSDGLDVLKGKPSSTTRNNTHDLGVVVHVLQPWRTITPGHADAWYELTVPTEAVPGSGDEVIDLTGLFASQSGAGLDMQVFDPDGNVLGSGEHIRIAAKQGERLTVHVFGKTGNDGARGSGAYLLDIDVLPQVVSVAGHTLLPSDQADRSGGPTSSLVITFQGDRLSRADAENASAYRVTWLGPDGVYGTPDDRDFTPNSGDAGVAAVVYNPSANVDISTGREYPTAVRQTITLLFATPLPAGSYRIDLNPLNAEQFTDDELGLLDNSELPLVTLDAAGHITRGASIVAKDLVAATGTLGDLSIFEDGTPFLSQFHDDLGALLDQALSAKGDQAAITTQLLQQMLLRLEPALGNVTSLLALFLDPVGFDFSDPGGQRVSYDLDSGGLGNQIANAFVSVAGNVELVVIPMAQGEYILNIDDVPATARGGAVLLGTDTSETISLTDSMRAGQRTFVIGVERSDPLPDGPFDPSALRSTPPEVEPAPPASAAQPPDITTHAPAPAGSAGPDIRNSLATPVFDEHLGGGDTTMTPEPDGDIDGLLRDLAEQFRILLGRLLGKAHRTEAPPEPASQTPEPVSGASGNVEPLISTSVPASQTAVPPLPVELAQASVPRGDVPCWALAPLLVASAPRRHRRCASRRHRRIHQGDDQ